MGWRPPGLRRSEIAGQRRIRRARKSRGRREAAVARALRARLRQARRSGVGAGAVRYCERRFQRSGARGVFCRRVRTAPDAIIQRSLFTRGGFQRLPELRKDPITGRWVIVATGRAKRPSDFSREPVKPFGNGFCPFCLGAEQKTPPEVLAFRSNGGGADQQGWSLRVVPNKFPVLEIEGELEREGEGMFDRMNGVGAHEGIIETPDQRTSLADLAEE